jgi:hypothetical protein
MKTLKITLALVAVLVLTVSGVQSENVVSNEQPTYEAGSHFDLLASSKKKIQKPSNS